MKSFRPSPVGESAHTDPDSLEHAVASQLVHDQRWLHLKMINYDLDQLWCWTIMMLIKYDVDRVWCWSGFFMLAMNFDDNNDDLVKDLLCWWLWCWAIGHDFWWWCWWLWCWQEISVIMIVIDNVDQDFWWWWCYVNHESKSWLWWLCFPTSPGFLWVFGTRQRTKWGSQLCRVVWEGAIYKKK